MVSVGPWHSGMGKKSWEQGGWTSSLFCSCSSETRIPCTIRGCLRMTVTYARGREANDAGSNNQPSSHFFFLRAGCLRQRHRGFARVLEQAASEQLGCLERGGGQRYPLETDVGVCSARPFRVSVAATAAATTVQFDGFRRTPCDRPCEPCR